MARQTQKPINLAVERAKVHGLPTEPAINESRAQYRERIARALYDAGHRIEAQEVLFNQRMSNDPFANGSLDRGYGDNFITQIAEAAEAGYQASNNEGCLSSFFKSFGRRGSKE